MTQDERWQMKFDEVMDFVKTNHRRPWKYAPEERLKYHWWRHQQKLMNAGELNEDRVKRFNKLLELGTKYRRKNQYE